MNSILKSIPLFLMLLPLVLFAKVTWPNWDISGEVFHITDGDTIKVEANDGADYTLRILGLDTPEKYTTRFGYVECFWEEASKYAQELLQWTSNSGARVYAELYEEDKYDRVLADVYLQDKPFESGSLFAEKMILNWFGWVYRWGVKTKNYNKLLRAETYAKKKKLWLWNKSTCNGERKPVNTTKNIKDSTNTWSTWSQAILTWAVTVNHSCKSVPRYCKDVKTRGEAQFYLNSCKAKKFDRDNDWIACEDIK
jgi:endonuclease YncB( thermonuclease family)